MMTIRKRSLNGALYCLTILTMGCSANNDGPRLVVIAGEVHLDGESLETGTISFLPEDGKGGAYGGDISKGRYSIEVSPGEKIVSIQSYHLSESLKGPDGKPAPVQFLPEQYNSKSELTATIPQNKPDPLDFHLDSTPQGQH